MTGKELYEAGRLDEAIAATVGDVKAHPTDGDRRGFLCELLCFAGELERADTQLEAMSHFAPDSAVGISMFRQLVRAEKARQQFYAEGRVPEFVGEPTAALRLHLEASIPLRDGNRAEAAKLLARAEEQRPAVAGRCDDAAFEDMRDLDDRTAGFFEVLTSTGKYFWIPTEQVASIEFRPPKRPRDLLWRRAHMIVRDGPDGEVFLPTIYAGAEDAPDSVRLGRSTDWREGDEGLVEGVGLRMFLIGDEGRTIMDIGTLDFG